MTARLTRAAYEQLIAEDLDWLRACPETLERRHIEEVLRVSPDREYEPRDWPAFWRSLPPHELLAAAKAMPKIAGPWRRGTAVTPEGHRFLAERPDACGGIAVGITYSTSREAADAALRAAGWILVDPEPEEGGRG